MLTASTYEVGSFVEVVGKVEEEENTLQELTSMPIAGNVGTL